MRGLALVKEWAQGDLNAVWVKESRQAVRSRALLTVFCLILAGLALLAFSYLATINEDQYSSGSSLSGRGASFFAFVSTLLGLAVMVNAIVTFYRAKQEREPGRSDLLFVTALSPGDIVRGKWGGSVMYAIMILSAGLPFMTIAYFMRGISLSDIGMTFLFLMGIALTLNLMAIFFAVLPCSGGLKITLFWLPMLLFMSAGMGGFGAVLVGSGLMAGAGGNVFLTILVTLFIFISLIWVYYSLAVFLLAPLASNRAFMLRVTLTGLLGVWLLWGLLASSEKWLEFSFVGCELLLIMGLFFGVASGDSFSRRVRREIEPSLGGRLRALFFYNGSATTLLWFAVLAMLMTGAVAIKIEVTRWSVFSGHVLAVSGLLNGYLLVYTLAALLLNRTFPKITMVGAFLVMTIGLGVVPFCFVAAFNNEYTMPLLGNLLGALQRVDNSRHLFYHAWFLVGVGLVLSLANYATWRDLKRSLYPAPVPVLGEEHASA